MNKAKRLLGVGYLPKELPIEFTSTTLSREFASVSAAIVSQPNGTPRSSPEIFNLSRQGLIFTRFDGRVV
jgi:hypothetical protein